MNAKMIIIALSVVLVIGGSIFLYQKNKQKQELQAYNLQKFKQATLAAQKSSAGGILLMASSIKKFHQTKGEYPSDLHSLYPDLIPYKPFIDDIDWHYTHEKNSFNIEHRIKKSSFISSMGPDMKLVNKKAERDIQHEMVAKAETSKPEKSPIAQINKIPIVLTKPIKPASLNNKVTQVQGADSEFKSKSEHKNSEPDINIVETELNQNENFLFFIRNSNLYIWKTKDNVIGFSNIQYPDNKDIRIYQDKKWIEYQYSSEKKASKKNKMTKTKGDV